MPGIVAAGIDLGTTYSSLAVVDERGEPAIVPNADGERLTPSAVFLGRDKVAVGRAAKTAELVAPDQVVTFVKRQMGNPHWHYRYDGQELSPADLSAMILAKLKNDAEQRLGCTLSQAVITVPAYFDDARRRATIAAGQTAGFEVLGLVNEPTAAAIAFGAQSGGAPETVLVYDLGGGTLDVTLMRVEGKRITILATDGDHQLGGKDFEDTLIQYVVEQFVREHGFDPSFDDPVFAARLRAQAERAKCALSAQRRATLRPQAGEKSSRVEVTRGLFENLIKPLVDRTFIHVKDALQSAALDAAQVDRVLLVGGSTRVPAVREALKRFFGWEPDHSVNPDEAVSLGAALMAAKKRVEYAPEEAPPEVVERVGGLQITDVTSHSLGIEAYVPGTHQRIHSILIPRNSPIPIDKSNEFRTTLPGQTAIQVTVYQGEFQDPALCNPIGEFTLSGLPPNRPAGCKVRVSVSCNTNGVVQVTALDIESGRQTTTQVSYAVGQSEQEISLKQLWMDSVPIV